jgi:hypothetical protein
MKPYKLVNNSVGFIPVLFVGCVQLSSCPSVFTNLRGVVSEKSLTYEDMTVIKSIIAVLI